MNLPTPDFGALEKNSNFSVSELRRVFERFGEICNARGKLGRAEFMQQPELTLSTLPAFVFDVECDNDETVDFNKFVKILDIFSSKTSLDEKFACESRKGEFGSCFLDTLLLLDLFTLLCAGKAGIDEMRWSAMIFSLSNCHDNLNPAMAKIVETCPTDIHEFRKMASLFEVENMLSVGL